MDQLKINDAISLLKQGYVLVSITNQIKIIVGYKNKLFYIKNDNANIILKEDEFKQIYNNNIFAIYDEESFEIDAKKDEEYYSFRHK